MADNYLENRMADYLSGHRTGPSASRSKGRAMFRYAPHPILVVGADCAAGREIVKILAATGSVVAFTAGSEASGRAVAHDCGGRFYPLTVAEAAADMMRRGEKPAVVVMFGDGVPEVEAPMVLTIAGSDDAVREAFPCEVILRGDDAVQLARLALVLTAEGSTVRGQTIVL